MLWLHGERIDQIFRAADQRAGFATAWPCHNQRGSGSLDGRFLKLIILLFRNGFCVVRGQPLRAGLGWDKGFRCQAYQPVEHGGIGYVEKIGKPGCRDVFVQIEGSYLLNGHEQFSSEDIGRQFTFAARIIGLADTQHLL